MLPSYREQPIESVAEQLQSLLERACREALGAPDRVSVVYDTVESDYHRQILQLRFVDGERPCTLLGVVTDDYDRRTGQVIKVLITVITFKSAKRSILSGRWKNPDGTPIQLPSRGGEPTPSPAPSAHAPAVSSEVVPTIAPAVAPSTAPASPTIDLPAPSEVPLGRDGRPKRGYRRGGSTIERDAFVLEILRREPEAPTTGQNGIHARVRERFGVGMREAHVAQLRAQLAVERAQLELAQGQGAPIGGGATSALLATVEQLLRAQDTIESAKRAANEALGRLKALVANEG